MGREVDPKNWWILHGLPRGGSDKVVLGTLKICYSPFLHLPSSVSQHQWVSIAVTKIAEGCHHTAISSIFHNLGKWWQMCMRLVPPPQKQCYSLCSTSYLLTNQLSFSPTPTLRPARCDSAVLFASRRARVSRSAALDGHLLDLGGCARDRSGRDGIPRSSLAQSASCKGLAAGKKCFVGLFWSCYFFRTWTSGALVGSVRGVVQRTISDFALSLDVFWQKVARVLFISSFPCQQKKTQRHPPNPDISRLGGRSSWG